MRQAVTADAIEQRPTVPQPPAGVIDPCGCGDAKQDHAPRPADAPESIETGPCMVEGCACTGFMSWAEKYDPETPYSAGKDAYIEGAGLKREHLVPREEPPTIHEIVEMVNEKAEKVAEPGVDGESASPPRRTKKIVTTGERAAKEDEKEKKYGPLRTIVAILKTNPGSIYVRLDCGHEAGAGKKAKKTRCRVCKAEAEGRKPRERVKKAKTEAAPKSKRQAVTELVGPPPGRRQAVTNLPTESLAPAVKEQVAASERAARKAVRAMSRVKPKVVKTKRKAVRAVKPAPKRAAKKRGGKR